MYKLIANVNRANSNSSSLSNNVAYSTGTAVSSVSNMNSLFNAASSLALKSTFKRIVVAAGADHLAFDEAVATSILIGLYFSIEFSNFNRLHKFN